MEQTFSKQAKKMYLSLITAAVDQVVQKRSIGNAK